MAREIGPHRIAVRVVTDLRGHGATGTHGSQRHEDVGTAAAGQPLFLVDKGKAILSG